MITDEGRQEPKYQRGRRAIGRANGYRLGVYLTRAELADLEAYCADNSVTKAEAVRAGLRIIQDEREKR